MIRRNQIGSSTVTLGVISSALTATTLMIISPISWAQNTAVPVLVVAPRPDAAIGDGTANNPFRSITAALTTKPQPGTVIQIAPGTYSADTTQEVFPLTIPRGVVLRGTPENRGEGVLIRGSGRFLSPSFAGQNVAVVLGDNTRLEGLTLTNGEVRGTAVWIERGKGVVITANTFRDSNREGLFMSGSAAAVVVDNLFVSNGANGISAVGSSSGEIRSNLFDNTGFGLAIGQRSTVRVLENRIVNNRDGIVISNVSRPVLRGNLIANNMRNGVVILPDRRGEPTPDLGSVESPGKNVFRANGEKDINNATAVGVVAIGNELDQAKLGGSVNLLPAAPESNAVPSARISKPAS
ncbi:MAG: DUF1565 domain-containing protein [Oscillatoriales cyanobacterium SM2_2_1]|nr:DUF1565 domain-containing protein [Oscillatoriales cyanobacterium SM2_2_1]